MQEVPQSISIDGAQIKSDNNFIFKSLEPIREESYNVISSPADSQSNLKSQESRMLETTKKRNNEKLNGSHSESQSKEKSSNLNLNYLQQTLAETQI